MIWGRVPKCDLCVGGDVTGSPHDLHIADEAAPDVAVAAVVDVGGMDEKTTCVEGVILFLTSTILGSLEMAVE